MNSHNLLESLITALEAYDDKIALQEALDGVRDFVCTLLVTEDIDADSFCAAVRERMPEIKDVANRLRSQEAQ